MLYNVHMITINEITQIDQLLKHVGADYHDIFVEEWYQGLDPYKEYPESLMLFANAKLNYWDIPLYAESVSWDEEHGCFIWHFTKRKL